MLRSAGSTGLGELSAFYGGDRVDSDVRVSTLPSGLTVMTERLPGAMSASVGVWLPVGSRDEGPEESGLSHLLEHTVFCGAGEFSALELVSRVESCGGEINAFTTQEETCLWGRVPGAFVDVLLGSLAAMVRSPHHAEDAVDAELDVVAAEMLSDSDDLVRVAHRSMLADVFAGHPLAYPVLGDPAVVLSARPSDLDRFLSRWWRPASSVVTASGAVDHDSFVGSVGRMLGDFGRPGPAAHARSVPSPVFPPDPLHPVSARKSSSRGSSGGVCHVSVSVPGLPAGHEDGVALAVLEMVAGAGMSSRLFTALRSDRQLAYTVDAFRTSFVDAGVFTVSAVCDPSVSAEVEKVLSEAVYSLSDMAGSEFDRAASLIYASRVMSFESTFSRMRYLGMRGISGLPVFSVGEDLSRLSDLDFDGVAGFAKRFATLPQHRQVVSLGAS